MVSKETLFPRVVAAKAPAKEQEKKKKPGFLQKSLGFLMEDASPKQAAADNTVVDYDALKRQIRERIVDALFAFLAGRGQLSDEKRAEIELILKHTKECALSDDPETRYLGLKTLFDIRLAIPGNTQEEPHSGWLGDSAAYGVPAWVVRLSVLEPLLDTLTAEDREKLLAHIEKCIQNGEEPKGESAPFPPDHPCAAVFAIGEKFTQPDNIDIVKHARRIPGKAFAIGPQLRYVTTPAHVEFINDTQTETLTSLIQTVRSAQSRAEEFCKKHTQDSVPIDEMSSGDAFDDMCACNLMLMNLLTKDADDVKGRERWVTFLSDMLNTKGVMTWPTLNGHSKSIDLMREHVEALQVIMDNLEHFSEGKIKLFLESFGSIEMMEKFYNRLKEEFPESLKIILPLPHFDALLRKAADAFKSNHKTDYDTVVHTMRSRLESMLTSEQKRDANAQGNVRGTQF